VLEKLCVLARRSSRDLLLAWPHGTSLLRPVSQVLPGVFWVYDVSAFMIEVSPVSVPASHFLARLCAIAGGVFTLAGLVEPFLPKR